VVNLLAEIENLTVRHVPHLVLAGIALVGWESSGKAQR
jgi:hypothetical protein